MGASSSHFSAASIPDGSLAGRRIVITGGSSGIGLEAAKVFAAKGATVLLTSRSQPRLDEAAAAVKKSSGAGDDRVETRPLDLSSFRSVNDFADWYIEAHGEKPLHVLLNNAGVMAFPDRRESADGLEMQMATNHLGHFLLTARMLPTLLRTAGSRIVNVSSMAHRWTADSDGTGISDAATKDPFRVAATSGGFAAGQYEPWKQYARTKMANLHFTLELNRRLEAAGRVGAAGVTVISAHPGYSATGLQATSGSMGGSVGAAIGNGLFAQSAAMGALPLVMASVSASVEAGQYIGPSGSNNMWGYPSANTPDPRALRAEAAEQLWGASTELTGADWSALDATPRS